MCKSSQLGMDRVANQHFQRLGKVLHEASICDAKPHYAFEFSTRAVVTPRLFKKSVVDAIAAM